VDQIYGRLPQVVVAIGAPADPDIEPTKPARRLLEKTTSGRQAKAHDH
jgi:hypothetical protein